MRIRDVLILLLFFMVPAANGLPGRAYNSILGISEGKHISSLYVLAIPSIVLCFFIIATRVIDRRIVGSDDESSAEREQGVGKTPYRLPLVLWILAAIISLLANDVTIESSVYFVSTFIGGGLAYFALTKLRIDQALVEKVFVAIALGSMFPLVSGLLEYYREWGIPNAETLVFSRYDLIRMTGYMDSTFGNVGNMAAFLMLIYGPMLTLSISKDVSHKKRAIFLAVVVLTCLHILIDQVRASIIALIVCSALVYLFNRSGQGSRFKIAALVGVVVVGPLWDAINIFLVRLSSAAFLDRAEDASVDSRFDAMELGWRIFQENWVVGIGPGESLTHHLYTSSHQFNVQQASELGMLGFVASTLLAIVIMFNLGKLVFKGQSNEPTHLGFLMLIGPATYIIYALLANAILSLGVVNTWAVLLFGLLGLAEGRPVLRIAASPAPDP